MYSWQIVAGVRWIHQRARYVLCAHSADAAASVIAPTPRPAAAAPCANGSACPKGRAIAALHDDPDRLRQPVRRRSDGDFEPIGWDEALDLAARGLARVRLPLLHCTLEFCEGDLAIAILVNGPEKKIKNMIKYHDVAPVQPSVLESELEELLPAVQGVAGRGRVCPCDAPYEERSEQQS